MAKSFIDNNTKAFKEELFCDCTIFVSTNNQDDDDDYAEGNRIKDEKMIIENLGGSYADAENGFSLQPPLLKMELDQCGKLCFASATTAGDPHFIAVLSTFFIPIDRPVDQHCNAIDFLP
uniref:Uncharacterized protein n=1 Tax=Romanomermis culicivorax TaxID=13658 RepID=A0A915IML1_ROMCU